jgi:hypothetical protein
MAITANLVLTLISAVADAFAFIISVALLSITISRIIRAKRHRSQIIIDVPSLVSINILCIIISKLIIQSIHITIPVLRKNFQNTVKYQETFLCHFRAYILWSLIGVLYWNYTLLVFFHFARVIYPQQKCLHRFNFYLYIYIPCVFMLIFISILPLLLIFDGIHLMKNELYCDLLIKPFYYVLYIGIIIFVLPYSIICTFYFCIIWKIRHTSSSWSYAERNRRVYVVIRRMLLNTVALGVVSTPGVILIIIYNLDDRFEEIAYGVLWVSSSLAALLFAGILPLITTQFHRLKRRNEITPVVTNHA